MKTRGYPDDAESVFYGGLFFLDDPYFFFFLQISFRFGKRYWSSLTTYLEDVSFPQKQAPIVFIEYVPI